MKNIILLLLTTLPIIGFSQENNYDTTAPYLKTKKIPDFSILDCRITTDSIWINNNALPKNKSVVFIYFSPECSHCELETEEIKKHMDSLKNATFVFVSYHPIEKIKAFYNKYDLGKYSNVMMGRDLKYFIPSFFRVEFTPFVAVYTPQGNFLKAYKQGADMTELIGLVQ
jgi:thiol-disulfide isomerase/thioredoxin